MPITDAALGQLTNLAGLELHYDAPLSQYTRFGIGGPAWVLADTSQEDAFIAAYRLLLQKHERVEVIGGGTNLVVSDAGFDGVVLRYTGKQIRINGSRVSVQAGAVLQDLVDTTIEHGLAGLHTMTGIPGWVGAAVYGNAGAYGRAMNQSIDRVRFFDGTNVREFDNEQCNFRYRESTFKDNKGWIIFSAEVILLPDDGAKLRDHADGIRKIRDAKYPPTMKCAGSIFKNLLFDQLPMSVQVQVDPSVIREGKVPSAWFLEQVGAKGLKNGDIHVAEYHANLIYNAGKGTARQVVEVVDELKRLVREKFGFEVEEEVQYVGF